MTVRLAAVLWVMFISCAYADYLSVSSIISGDEVILSDGRLVRLAGVKSLMPEAKEFLELNLTGKEDALRDAAIDRYGRVAATVLVQGQTQSVEDELLQKGLAFVYPASGDEPHLDDMLSLEKKLDSRTSVIGAIMPMHPPTMPRNYMANMVL